MGLHEKSIKRDYVATTLEQLIELAIKQENLFLAYLLGMALAEANERLQAQAK